MTDNTPVMERARRVLLDQEDRLHVPPLHAARSDLDRRLSQAIAAAGGPQTRIREGQRNRRWMTVAAGCAAAGVIAVLGWWQGTSRHASPDQVAAARVYEYATAPGQRTTVTLSDGSIVTLNVGSRLRVPETFGGSSRTLYLDGEAVFTVTHRAHSPFVVHAGGTIVRDLATKFNVRAYPGDGQVTVAVAQGRVMVESPRAALPTPVVLDSAAVATVFTNDSVTVDRDVSIQQHFGWTSGELTFRDAEVRDILTQLSRWYDLDIRITTPSLAQRRITTVVTGQRSGDDVVRDIATVIGARVERVGKTIILTQP